MTARLHPEAGTVAVSGLHRGDNPQPGAAVVASLRRRFPQLRIVGLSYDPMESSIYIRGSDHLDAAYLLPYPRSGAARLLERLDGILAREAVRIIIPCLDSELPNFIHLRRELVRREVKCALPTKAAFARRGKERLGRFCRSLGIPAPITRMANDADRLADLALTIGYPVYVKGRLYEARLVRTETELRAAFHILAEIWGPPVLVQEAVTGEEYDIVGLGDGKGMLLGHCTIRKMLRTSAGKAFGGIAVADPQLDDLARRVIRALRWNGPFELEFIKTPGRPHMLFEMNPRFPAWVDFPSQLGCNLPARLFERLEMIGETPMTTCRPGQMFVRHSTDLLGDIADLASLASAGERVDPPLPVEPEALP